MPSDLAEHFGELLHGQLPWREAGGRGESMTWEQVRELKELCMGDFERLTAPHSLPGPMLGMAEHLAGEQEAEGFDPAGFRDRSGIGRNLTIELLEFFDRAGFTLRTELGRSILAPAREAFDFK